MAALPWQTPAGMFSPLRAAALALALTPAAMLAWRISSGTLGPRPLNTATLETGDWALQFVLVTLAITPLRRILDWPRLIAARQIFGLASFAYALAHLALYIAEQKFDLALVASEIVRRVYLGLGAVPLILMAILAAHSGAKAARRLGSELWNHIHKLVYLIVPMGILHFILKSKIDVTQPLLLTGLWLWLMGWRLLPRQARDSIASLILLALGSAGATLLLEVVWYATRSGAAASDIISENFDFSFEIRNMWIVLAITLLPVVGRLARPLWQIRGPTTNR